MKHLKAARIFARLMDDQFSFLGVGVGLDSLIGLIPRIGDVFSLFFSLYLIWIAYNMKVPIVNIIEMIANVFIDTLIGSIPIVGDIGDVFFKANIRNLKILEKFAEGKESIVEGEVIRE